MTKEIDKPTAETNDSLEALKQLVARWTAGKEGPVPTLIEGLRFARLSKDIAPTFYIQETSVCFVLQARKTVMLGEKTYVYDPASCLVASVDLPVTGYITGASPEKPYLGIVLNVSSKDMAALIIEQGRQPVRREESEGQALAVTQVTPVLADPLLRLIKLLDTPAEIPIMAPMIKREINFRLLQTEQFDLLSQATVGDGKLRRVSHAIAWIKENLALPLRIEKLAEHVHMSPSGLHHHFKEVTTLSPLQFQKRLRLQKARQMMLTDKTSAEKIAYLVGYESPSQFSREYARLFGQPPARDAASLQGALPQND